MSDSPGDKSLKNKTNQNTQYISSPKQNNTIIVSLQAELMLQKVLWIFAVTTNHDSNIQVFFFCWFFFLRYWRGILSYWNGTRLQDVIVKNWWWIFLLLLLLVVVFCHFHITMNMQDLFVFSVHTYIYYCIYLSYWQWRVHFKKPASRHGCRNNRRIWEHHYHARVPDRRQIGEGWRKRSQIGLIYSFWGSSGLQELLVVCYSSRFKSAHNNKQREFQLFVFSWLCDRKKKNPANC